METKKPDEFVLPHGFVLMPPAPDVCQQCAVKHAPEDPHNNGSLYWQYWFYSQHRRWPTWKDALSHCDETCQKFWKDALIKHGVDPKTFD